MPLIEYIKWNPKGDSLQVVDVANSILADYAEDGYTLSLRQLYYQFVARDLIPNTERDYKRLGNIISKARKAGLIDWDTITDRGRPICSKPHWDDGRDFLDSVLPQFNLDLWEGQPIRCQVWVEKQALEDVVARACTPWDVPYFSNKGYLSDSAIWKAAHGMLQDPTCDNWVILHLGDHDPSGIDMSRDIQDRVSLYSKKHQGDQVRTRIKVKRIALNLDQIDEYNPPPNPAKTTDSRFSGYQKKYGDSSWELDALEPQVIVDCITKYITMCIRDSDVFENRKTLKTSVIQQLSEVELE